MSMFMNWITEPLKVISWLSVLTVYGFLRAVLLPFQIWSWWLYFYWEALTSRNIKGRINRYSRKQSCKIMPPIKAYWERLGLLSDYQLYGNWSCGSGWVNFLDDCRIYSFHLPNKWILFTVFIWIQETQGWLPYKWKYWVCNNQIARLDGKSETVLSKKNAHCTTRICRHFRFWYFFTIHLFCFYKVKIIYLQKCRYIETIEIMISFYDIMYVCFSSWKILFLKAVGVNFI